MTDEALRLADALGMTIRTMRLAGQIDSVTSDAQAAAAELRRQHAEIERLRAALGALMLTANQAQIDMAAQGVLIEWQDQMRDAVVAACAALEQT